MKFINWYYWSERSECKQWNNLGRALFLVLIFFFFPTVPKSPKRGCCRVPKHWLITHKNMTMRNVNPAKKNPLMLMGGWSKDERCDRNLCVKKCQKHSYEHWSNIMSQKEDSHMVNHWMEAHQSNCFLMFLYKYYTKKH